MLYGFFLGGWFIIFGIGFTIAGYSIIDEMDLAPGGLSFGILCISMSTILLIVCSCMCHCAQKYHCFETHSSVYSPAISTNFNRTYANSIRQPRTENHDSTHQNSGSECHSIPPPYQGQQKMEKEDSPPSYSEAISMPSFPSQT